jgi:glycosyltransferase involved in cell wall biosynthesis
LSANPCLWLLLVLMLPALFAACLRHARKFDLIHAQWSISGVIGGLAGKLAGKPVITTLRGSDVNLAVFSYAHRTILRLCVRLSDKIVTVSNSLNTSVRKLNPDIAGKKFCVIPNGIDDTYFGIARNHYVVKPTLEIITVGNLTANKGVDQILRSLHYLNDESLLLRIVGDGPERPRLAALTASLGLQRQVEFAGSVAPSRMAHLLAAADIFVLASHSEGRPNVLIEAMASALPVIATDIPGIREVITTGVNGLLFPDSDVAGLSVRLRELARSPVMRHKLGAAARRFVVDSGLSWNTAAKRYHSLYNEVLAKTSLRMTIHT